jgi:hypothetical protein
MGRGEKVTAARPMDKLIYVFCLPPRFGAFIGAKFRSVEQFSHQSASCSRVAYEHIIGQARATHFMCNFVHQAVLRFDIGSCFTSRIACRFHYHYGMASAHVNLIKRLVPKG